MSLTEQQRRFFTSFGFLHLRGQLADEIGWITEEFEQVWRDGVRSGYDGKGELIQAIVPFVDHSERLCTLVDHPRLEPALECLLGKDYNYLSSDGRPYSGDTGWHPDGGWSEPQLFLKVAFYLDPLTRTSGALRVIPGSHRVGDRFSADSRAANDSVNTYGVPMSEIPSVALETQPGDVVIFNHNTMHSSFGGGNRRRMFTMNLGKHADTPAEEERLREYIGIHLSTWADHVYGEIMRATATPRRMRHMAQVMANEGHLPALREKKLAAAALARSPVPA